MAKKSQIDELETAIKRFLKENEPHLAVKYLDGVSDTMKRVLSFWGFEERGEYWILSREDAEKVIANRENRDKLAKDITKHFETEPDRMKDKMKQVTVEKQE